MADLDSGYEAREEEKKARAAHRAAMSAAGAGAEEKVDAENRGRIGTPGGGGSDSGEKGDGKDGMGQGADGKKEKHKGVDGGVLDLSLVRTDPNKLYPIIYYAWKVRSGSLSLCPVRSHLSV